MCILRLEGKQCIMTLSITTSFTTSSRAPNLNVGTRPLVHTMDTDPKGMAFELGGKGAKARMKLSQLMVIDIQLRWNGKLSLPSRAYVTALSSLRGRNFRFQSPSELRLQFLARKQPSREARWTPSFSKPVEVRWLKGRRPANQLEKTETVKTCRHCGNRYR